MSCCNQNCNQGRTCPNRTRRVKAGGPPPADDMPIQFVEPEPAPFDRGLMLRALVLGTAIGSLVWAGFHLWSMI